MSNSIAILGASPNKEKFSNKAIRAYITKGYNVIPINPKYEEIEGIKTVSLEKISSDIISVYLKPEIFEKLLPKIPNCVKRVILNPGTESDKIISLLKEKHIQPLMICSILSLGLSPENF